MENLRTQHLLNICRKRYKKGSDSLIRVKTSFRRRLAWKTFESTSHEKQGYSVLNYSCPSRGIIKHLFTFPPPMILCDFSSVYVISFPPSPLILLIFLFILSYFSFIVFTFFSPTILFVCLWMTHFCVVSCCSLSFNQLNSMFVR